MTQSWKFLSVIEFVFDVDPEVRAVASHKCVPGSIPGLHITCQPSSLHPAPRHFAEYPGFRLISVVFYSVPD